METREEIYRDHIRYGTSQDCTVRLITSLLTERLSDGYRKIWVQSTNRGRLCFTIFGTSGYTMRFHDTGGMRQFRTEDPLEVEMVAMERFLEILRTGPLSDFID
jgi:hypothetical protein